MEILEKEFTKYLKPMFFNIGRIIVYLIGVIIMLGIYSRIEDSQFIFVNFFIVLVIGIVFLIIDVWVALKKSKTYQDHKVQFFDTYLVFVDHRGTYKLAYNEMSSFQLGSSQILIRIHGSRFMISGKLHGINFDELKLMADFLISKGVISKVGRGFIYFIGAFLIINYGFDYIFIQVLKLTSDASLFGTLYICLIIGMGYYIWEQFNVRKLIDRER